MSLNLLSFKKDSIVPMFMTSSAVANVADNSEIGGDIENSAIGGKENPKPDWIVGKLFAEWCGHCKTMKPEWAKLKTDTIKKKGGKIKFIEIEDKTLGHDLPEMNRKYFMGVEHGGITSSGFPTIFMFQVSNPGKTLEYYQGERNMVSMQKWIFSHFARGVRKTGKKIHGRKTGKFRKTGKRMRGGKTGKRMRGGKTGKRMRGGKTGKRMRGGKTGKRMRGGKTGKRERGKNT